MAGVGRELSKGAEEVGRDDEDTGTGGHQPTGIRDVFQGGGTGSSFIMVRDMRADPLPAWDRPFKKFQHRSAR